MHTHIHTQVGKRDSKVPLLIYTSSTSMNTNNTVFFVPILNWEQYSNLFLTLTQPNQERKETAKNRVVYSKEQSGLQQRTEWFTTKTECLFFYLVKPACGNEKHFPSLLLHLKVLCQFQLGIKFQLHVCSKCIHMAATHSGGTVSNSAPSWQNSRS